VIEKTHAGAIALREASRCLNQHRQSRRPKR
jgi:hypothetical protein